MPQCVVLGVVLGVVLLGLPFAGCRSLQGRDRVKPKEFIRNDGAKPCDPRRKLALHNQPVGAGQRQKTVILQVIGHLRPQLPLAVVEPLRAPDRDIDALGHPVQQRGLVVAGMRQADLQKAPVLQTRIGKFLGDADRIGRSAGRVDLAGAGLNGSIKKKHLHTRSLTKGKFNRSGPIKVGHQGSTQQHVHQTGLARTGKPDCRDAGRLVQLHQQPLPERAAFRRQGTGLQRLLQPDRNRVHGGHGNHPSVSGADGKRRMMRGPLRGT